MKYNNFGEFLENFLKKNNFTLEHVANRTGVTFGALGHYKNSRRIPKVDFLERFLVEFNFSEEEKEEIRILVELDRAPHLKLKIEKLTSFNHRKNNLEERIIIPMYGKASAGYGYINLDSKIDDFEIPAVDYKKGRHVVLVEGNSMENNNLLKDIPQGAIALVDPSMCTSPMELEGKVCVFTYNDETYIKKLEYNRDLKMVILKSFNPSYKDIFIPEERLDDLECKGRVVKTYMEYKW